MPLRAGKVGEEGHLGPATDGGRERGKSTQSGTPWGENLPNKTASPPALLPSHFKTHSFKINSPHMSFREPGCLTTSFPLTKNQKTKHSTVIPQYPRATASRAPHGHQNRDVQAPYIKWPSAVGPLCPWVLHPYPLRSSAGSIHGCETRGYTGSTVLVFPWVVSSVTRA